MVLKLVAMNNLYLRLRFVLPGTFPRQNKKFIAADTKLRTPGGHLTGCGHF